jgi:hypothetical protein
MTPVMKRLTDIAIILGVSAGIAFLIIVSANSLVSKASVWHSYYVWLAFVRRPDTIVTTLLAIAVTMGVATYHQGRGRK